MDDAGKRLEAIIDAAVFGIITIDERGLIEQFNSAAERMFQYAAEDVIGHNVSMLMPEPFRSDHDGYLASYLATGEKKIIGLGREVVGRRRDGTEFPLHLTISEVRLEQRVLFTGMVEDISVRVEAEQRVQELQDELIHVARLSAMGELASALAHELNQPLTAITNYSNAAKRLLERGKTSGATDLVLKAGDQAIRAGEIIRRLRQFIERGETERSWQNLIATTREAAQLGLFGTRSLGIEFALNHDHDLPEVMIDKIQIQQVVQNLVRNAADELAFCDGDRRIWISLRKLPPARVEIAVEDTGPGLSSEVKEKLFQPFVTTKPNGMGVGLSVCRNIIESHGGWIRGEDRPGGGTVFRVNLPVSQD
ncbi:MAG: PAS domain S-box protein [Pseudomonadota bacterium]